MKKILITGSNGLLGQAIKRLINDDVYDIYAIDRAQADFNSKRITQFYFDLTDTELLYNILKQVQPDIIIHCAALTNVDLCETDNDLAFLHNFVVTTTLADYANNYHKKIVFLSTDCVFDGLEGPYSEEATVNPINYYGNTKAFGELILTTFCRNIEYIIARTTVIYGAEECNKKNFVDWVIEQLQQGKQISVVDGQYGNPTYNEDLAYMILSLIDMNAKGIFNLCGSEYLSRYRFARKIAQVFGYNMYDVLPIPESDLKQKAQRPSKGGFTTHKITEYLGHAPLDCYTGLERMKERKLGLN